jgi:hypothetical protein
MRWTWLILAVPLAALAPTAVQAQAQAGAEGKGLVA